MTIFPIKLKDNPEALERIKIGDVLIYDENPDLLRNNLDMDHMHHVIFVHDDSSVNTACYSGGQNAKPYADLLSQDFWYLLPFPAHLIH